MTKPNFEDYIGLTVEEYNKKVAEGLKEEYVERVSDEESCT